MTKPGPKSEETETKPFLPGHEQARSFIDGYISGLLYAAEAEPEENLDDILALRTMLIGKMPAFAAAIERALQRGGESRAVAQAIERGERWPSEPEEP